MVGVLSRWMPDDTLELPEGGDWAVRRRLLCCIVMGVGVVSVKHTVNTPTTRGERIFYHVQSGFVTGSIRSENGKVCYSAATSTKKVVIGTR